MPSRVGLPEPMGGQAAGHRHRELSPVQRFSWLKITLRPCGDDLGISDDQRLLVSERAMKVLARHRLEHADIEVSAAPEGEAQV
jgi:hypothetical protein